MKKRKPVTVSSPLANKRQAVYQLRYQLKREGVPAKEVADRVSKRAQELGLPCGLEERKVVRLKVQTEPLKQVERLIAAKPEVLKLMREVQAEAVPVGSTMYRARIAKGYEEKKWKAETDELLSRVLKLPLFWMADLTARSEIAFSKKLQDYFNQSFSSRKREDAFLGEE